MANAQQPVSTSTIREAINGYVEAFLHEWQAANPTLK
jgi:hypothetical protein